MKFTILEKTYTFIKHLGHQYVIYVNPTSNELSVVNETKWNRGVIDENGDFYVEARILDEEEAQNYRYNDNGLRRRVDVPYSNMTHIDMVHILTKIDETLFQGINDAPSRGYNHWGMNKWYLSKMVCMTRIRDTNKFQPSEIYEIDVPLNLSLILKAKKKNPTLKFVR